MENSASTGFHYLIGNYYFPLLFDDGFIDHFETLCNSVDFSKYNVHIYGYLNLPGFDWSTGTVSNMNSATFQKAEGLLSFSKVYGFTQFNFRKKTADNALDLCLSNIPIENLVPAVIPFLPVNAYHPHFLVQFRWSCRPCANYQLSWFRYRNGYYYGLYDRLAQHNWSDVLSNQNADLAAPELTTVVSTAMSDFIPKRQAHKSKFPNVFSRELNTYFVVISL